MIFDESEDAEMCRADYERDAAIDRELLERREPRPRERQEIEDAVLELVLELGATAARFAEAIHALRGIPAALEHGDRAEASRLLSAAADIECDLTGDTRATCDLFATLGLDDLADPEGGS